MYRSKKITVKATSSTITLTPEQATSIGIDITKHEIKGDLKVNGVWQLPVSYKAIAISEENGEYTIYGRRTMTQIRQSGYAIEGWTRTDGIARTCFSSSHLFKVNGKLIDVAVIYVRLHDRKNPKKYVKA